MPILSLLAPLFIAAAGFFPASTRSAGSPEIAARPLGIQQPWLVIGFMGGFIRRDDPARSEYLVAEDLRLAYPAGLLVQTFENRKRGEALKMIHRFLDTNHDGILSPEEKRNARIILYGHSWGGNAVIQLARDLQREQIPVVFTVQVDSIGRRSNLVPPNVARAANFFQPDGLLHGGRKIRAADPSRTEIIGNFEIAYKKRQLNCVHYPWYERLFAKTHTQIACDPAVWSQVELLIRSELPGPHSIAQ